MLTQDFSENSNKAVKKPVVQSQRNIPDQIVQSHQLSGIILEYRRECSSSSIVQSLCEPEEDGILKDGVKQDSSLTLINGFSFPSKKTL
ncbi:hypothetical protein LWI29_008717 [Acer saccharum]|uniref:Uncharacterized protein n=1 Tax=Acer saccharum TaxID=4024 RepID=A0AA39TCN5_ACESA|nr:hypothetical protein LWI29_008717 [Acer saccharum]